MFVLVVARWKNVVVLLSVGCCRLYASDSADEDRGGGSRGCTECGGGAKVGRDAAWLGSGGRVSKAGCSAGDGGRGGGVGGIIDAMVEAKVGGSGGGCGVVVCAGGGKVEERGAAAVGWLWWG